jgi:hypothetical protein
MDKFRPYFARKDVDTEGVATGFKVTDNRRFALIHCWVRRSKA